jgi:tripartite-type tricarboxylate transporter receptor subunit TctC
MAKALLAAALLAGVVTVAGAQNFPVKPVRIVTTEAGSGTDFGARMVAQCIAGPLGQPVVVENRGGVMPNEVVAKALPDGYTIVHNGSALWLLPFVQAGLNWNPQRDFIAVSMTDQSPNVLLVQPSFPARSVQELIALARAKPGELNYARAAPAGPTHFSAELFNVLAGIKIKPIPFKGGGPAVIGLLSAQAHLMFAPAAVAMPHVNSGKLRGLAVTTAQPSALFPQLPTMAAAGVPGYEYVAMFGEFVPTGTPLSIVNRLSGEIQRCMQKPEVREKFLAAGVEAVGTTPEQFDAIVKAEMAKWGRLIKDTGIRAD